MRALLALIAACALLPVASPITTASALPTSVEPEPPVTANEFLPENRDLTDCIGALQRPGCGSEARGGWRQTLVFVVMGAAMVFVFTRVAIGVRRNRRATDAAAES